MSERQAEETAREADGEAGSVSAGSTVPPFETPAEMAAATALSVLEAPAIAPDHEAPPKADAPEPVMPKAEATPPPRIESPRMDAPRPAGRVLIMAPNDRAWHDHSADVKVESEPRPSGAAPKRSSAGRPLFGTAAMLVLATLAGAVGGALATTGFTHVADAAAPALDKAADKTALEASIARIDADVLALKAGLEHTSKTSLSQFNKTSDRLDKIEKAQAEPNARLAKLTETVDKLRTAPAAAPAASAAATPAAAPAPKEVTGSVAPPATAAATPAAPKPEVGRLPTVDGWSIADVGYGSALIQSRRGTYEVYAGDYLPGLGRIDAIRKQDGRWVVVTSKGLIVAR